jgi:tRNA-specific 2-thiouridylase
MLVVNYLNRTILPLGTLTKEEVRKKSRELDLQTHNRPDSQDLCFLGDLDYRQFLLKYTKDRIIPGEIVDENGNVIGKHDGLPFYTIGQRKGLRIAYNQPLYVLEKDQNKNRLIVGIKQHKRNCEFLINNFNWINTPLRGDDKIYTIKVRYKSRDVPAKIHSLGSDMVKANITSENIPEIVPGQVAVIYSDHLCMGGGIIV